MTTASQHFDDSFPSRQPMLGGASASRLMGITFWLVLLMAIGVWIAIYDGSTRPYIPDEEFLPLNQILAYEAYKAGWVFAAVALPLVLLHGSKLKFSISDSFLMWFVLCTAAYTKDFAYIKVPNAPIYITDVTLALLFVSNFLWPKLRVPKFQALWMKALALFIVLGMIAAARGIAGRMDTVDVLRDAALFVYPAFILIGFFARRKKELAEQVCLMVVCGALIGTITGVAWYLAEPDMRRYISYFYVPLAFMLVVFAIVSRRVKTIIGAPLLVLLGWGIVVSNTRSTYVSLAPTLLLMAIMGIGTKRFKDVIKPMMITAVTLVIGIGLFLQTREGEQYFGRIFDQLVSVVLHTGDDPNSQWRLLAWAEAFRRFVANPVIGEGFGNPLTFELMKEDVRPHNIYLTVLYKLGLTGFFAFAALLAPALWAAWRTVRKCIHRDTALLQGLFLCQFFLVAFGAVNPLIETPFMASYFWLNFGLMIGLARQIKLESEPRVPNPTAP
jgi:O-antigen ligase